MNHHVPDFDIDYDYSIPVSSGSGRPRKTAMAEDDIMELLWQNGQVVMQNQAMRPIKKSASSKSDDAVPPGDQSTAREIQPLAQHDQHQQQRTTDHLFMQEDEMASWLHYPLNDANFDGDLCADLLYPSPCVTSTSAAQRVRTPNAAEPSAPGTTASKPPIPLARRTELETTMQNFPHFSRLRARAEPAPLSSKTGVDSSDTHTARVLESRVSEAIRGHEGPSGENNASGTLNVDAAVAATSSAAAAVSGDVGGGKEIVTCEVTVTSSPGCSSASASAEPAQKPPTADRKRKGTENEEMKYHSEDVDFESGDAKKQTRGSTSTKRSRAAEVHNLSERRRRDRINEKMRALQELIPRCNKSDKASMLDEAIEYLKSLQLQVQMMSMGCGLVPMMFPGVQQYMPPVGMGMALGMGMEMGVTRPMVPFPNILPCSAMPTPAVAAHLAPRFPMPAFHMPPIPAAGPSRIQTASQSDPMLNSFGLQNPNQPQMPSFPDPYQQYLGQRQMQMSQGQNQATGPPTSSKPSTGGENDNLETHQSG